MNTKQLKYTPLDLLGKIVLGSAGNRQFLQSTVNKYNAEDARAFMTAKQYAGYKLLQLEDRCILIAEDGNTLYQLKNNTYKWVAKTIHNENRKYGYAIISVKDKHLYVHRLMWEAHKYSIPANMTIDHIDGNHFNNDISNLQLMTQADNSRKGIKDTRKKGLL